MYVAQFPCVQVKYAFHVIFFRVETNIMEEEAQLRRQMDDELCDMREEFCGQHALRMQEYELQLSKRRANVRLEIPTILLCFLIPGNFCLS